MPLDTQMPATRYVLGYQMIESNVYQVQDNSNHCNNLSDTVSLAKKIVNTYR